MTKPNHKLEFELTYNGKPWCIRPELDPVIAIEAATNQSCLTLAAKCYRGDISLAEMATIVHALLKHYGNTQTANDVLKTLWEDGFQDLREPVGDILGWALKGNKEHEKQAKAEAEEAARTAAKGGTGSEGSGAPLAGS